jgi:beta-lactamase superfamily II metal-dependent hydrolase
MLKLTALGIGHGDATLLQWFEDTDLNKPGFTCLVDGGESHSKLKQTLDHHLVEKIDLLVLTHFDADHIGGLDGIWDHYKIHTYWAPCLAAFERHMWLFGSRIKSGLVKARHLEDSLRKLGVDVMYPLDGHSSSPLKTGDLSLHILSPAARLIRTLLLDRDVEWLFTQTPMPLGWLGSPDEPPLVEQPANHLQLDQRLRTGVLIPEDVAWISRDAAKPGASEVQRQWSVRTGIEPEFFGDSVLNNTSLVIWLNISLGARSHKVLLTGDQENWTYLLMQHPLGLQVDLLKSPHHGGQLYMEQESSNEEVLSTVRPRALLFSANGRHGLPHSDIRASAMRWGASVFCTSERGTEIIMETGSKQQAPCCHEQFSCDGSQDVGVIFDERGIHADRTACHTGFGTSPGPIIQIRQHLVERSPVVQHLHEGELRKHLGWLKKELKQIHTERARLAPQGQTGGEPIIADHLSTLARSTGRTDLVFYLNDVLAKGWERNEFWSSTTEHGYREQRVAYALPSTEELDLFLELLRSKEMLLFVGTEKDTIQDKSTRLATLDRSRLSTLCDQTRHFPSAMFNEAFWPAVYKELLDWHCYHRPSDQNRSVGLLAFSRYASAKEMFERLLERMGAPGGDNNEGLSRPLEWSSPMVFTGESKSTRSWVQVLFSQSLYSSRDEIDYNFARILGISLFSPKLSRLSEHPTAEQIEALAVLLATHFPEAK